MVKRPKCTSCVLSSPAITSSTAPPSVWIRRAWPSGELSASGITRFIGTWTLSDGLAEYGRDGSTGGSFRRQMAVSILTSRRSPMSVIDIATPSPSSLSGGEPSARGFGTVPHG